MQKHQGSARKRSKKTRNQNDDHSHTYTRGRASPNAESLLQNLSVKEESGNMSTAVLQRKYSPKDLMAMSKNVTEAALNLQSARNSAVKLDLSEPDVS